VEACCCSILHVHFLCPSLLLYCCCRSPSRTGDRPRSSACIFTFGFMVYKHSAWRRVSGELVMLALADHLCIYPRLFGEFGSDCDVRTSRFRIFITVHPFLPCTTTILTVPNHRRASPDILDLDGVVNKNRGWQSAIGRAVTELTVSSGHRAEFSPHPRLHKDYTTAAREACRW
jgi:hypothetical protein